jgi:hypothetical protein
MAHLAPLTVFRGEARHAGKPTATENPSGHPVFDLPCGAVLYSNGLKLPPELDLESWKLIGAKLANIAQGVQWAVGDWWCHGYHQYGERKAVAAARLLPFEFGTLMNWGSVARKIDTSRRREDVSFSHHVEVAKLPADKQERWLARAVEHRLSTKKLRQQIAQHQERDLPGFFEPTPHDEASGMLFNLRSRLNNRFLCDFGDDPRFDYLSEEELHQLLRDIQDLEDICASLKSTVSENLSRRGDDFKPRPLPRPRDLVSRNVIYDDGATSFVVKGVEYDPELDRVVCVEPREYDHDDDATTEEMDNAHRSAVSCDAAGDARCLRNRPRLRIQRNAAAANSDRRRTHDRHHPQGDFDAPGSKA